MKKKAEHPRILKKKDYLPKNPSNRKVTGPQVLQAYHEKGSVTGAAKALGIAKSTASEAISRAKETPEYREIIQPKLDQLRLELAAIALLNTAKVKKSLQIIPPGWDYIKSFGTIVDKVTGLGERGGAVAAVALKVEINPAEKRERFLRVADLEPDERPA